MLGQERRIGDWIADRYEIFDVHTGGMGVVFVVYDHQGPSGQRVLAIKALRDEFLRDRRSIARFTIECDAWIRLDRHPNIVRAYSVRELEGKPHVVLELVTGGDLRRWIGTPRLDIPQVLRFAVQFCLGMEHAAQKGLHCHRDIKPENLLISEGGTLKITDFGLAKVRDESSWSGEYVPEPIPLAGAEEPTHRPRSPAPKPRLPPPPPSRGSLGATVDYAAHPEPIVPATLAPRPEWSARSLDPDGGSKATIAWSPGSGDAGAADEGSDLNPMPAAERPGPGPEVAARAAVTRAGAMLGTGPYMSPEQFRDAKAVDLRADVYSFGIVLFEMIAGHRPFQGDTYEKLARQHERAEPGSIVRHVPSRHAKIARPLDRIVHRCLAKEASRRFASFFELRRVLARCLWLATRESLKPPTELELEAWELTNKGTSLGILGRHDEERSGYEAALRVKADYVPAWFNQAAALGDSGHPDEAVEHADVALHLNPQSVPALINKALALNLLGQAERALTLLSEAARLQPRDPDVWFGRAFVLLNRGNLEGARSALDQSLRLRPGDPQSLYALGVAVARTATWADAEALFTAAGDRASALAVADYYDRGELPRLRHIPWIRRTEDSATEAVGG